MHRTRPRRKRPVGRHVHARLRFVDNVYKGLELSCIPRSTANVLQLEDDLDDLRNGLFGAARPALVSRSLFRRLDRGMYLLCDSRATVEAAPVEVVGGLVARGINIHRIGEVVGLLEYVDTEQSIDGSVKTDFCLESTTPLTLR